MFLGGDIMDEIKKENYQLTIYKLSEFKALDELSRELELKLGKGKESKNNEVLDIKDNIKILYFSFIKDNTGNDITWFKKWNGFFGITNPLRASSTTGHGAIVIELTQLQQQYLLTFGKSASLFKEFLIPNYGISIAEKLFNGKTMDSVSSKYFSLTKNKSLISYAQGSSYNFEEGEAADLLKAKIEEHKDRTEKRYIEQLLGYIKPLATISYSNIKLTISKEEIELDDLIDVVALLSSIESSYSSQLDIPQMKPIKKNQEQPLNDKLWESIKAKDQSVIFSVPIFTKDVDDYYVFLDSIDSVTLKYRRVSQVYENFCIEDLFSFVENNPQIEGLNQIHCTITRNQIEREEPQLQKWLEAQIELDGTTYALHNGKWYSFNDYYLERVDKRITEIEADQQTLIWDDSFSVDSKMVDKFCEDNSDDMVKLFSSEGNTPLSSIYREFRYNFYTAKKRGWNLFDRCISDSVELCDLSNPNEAFIHCKIGGASNLEECLRQSMISLLYFSQNQPSIESYQNREGQSLTRPREIVILYLSESDIDSNFKISTLKSLKCKLTFLNWFNHCVSMRYIPKIIVAKYNKNK